MHLFDMTADDTTAPEDATPRRGRRGPRPSPVADSPAESAVVAPALPARAIRPLGDIEGAPCDCGTSLWEIMDEWRGEWKVECWACYRRRKMAVVVGHLKPRSDFTLRDGRFAGMTLDEAAREPHGLEVLRVYASGHKRPEVREAVRKFLDGCGPTR